MKRLILIFTIIGFFFLAFGCQEYSGESGVKFPFGEPDMYGQSAVDTAGDEAENDTIATTKNDLLYANFAIDSTHTIDIVPDDELNTGAVAYLEITNANASVDQTLSFGANIVGNDETLTAGKTSIIHLFYADTSYNVVSVKQID